MSMLHVRELLEIATAPYQLPSSRPRVGYFCPPWQKFTSVQVSHKATTSRMSTYKCSNVQKCLKKLLEDTRAFKFLAIY
jgi:hypothetical protein